MNLCKHIDYEVLAIDNIFIDFYNDFSYMKMSHDHLVPFWHIL